MSRVIIRIKKKEWSKQGFEVSAYFWISTNRLLPTQKVSNFYFSCSELICILYAQPILIFLSFDDSGKYDL